MGYDSWHGWNDLNTHLSVLETDVLPLNYIRICCELQNLVTARNITHLFLAIKCNTKLPRWTVGYDYRT